MRTGIRATKQLVFIVRCLYAADAPVAGVKGLREAVANLYNIRYRQNHHSKYTTDNICIVPGGRAGLTRIAAVIGDVNVGFFLPEYTAYEQMLSVGLPLSTTSVHNTLMTIVMQIFKRFIPIPTPLNQLTGFHVTPEFLRQEVTQRGLNVVVCSNPANPTGQVVEGEEMMEWIKIAKEHHTTLVNIIMVSDASQNDNNLLARSHFFFVYTGIGRGKWVMHT